MCTGRELGENDPYVNAKSKMAVLKMGWPYPLGW